MPVKTIEWVEDGIRIIDQTRLPGTLAYLDIRDVETLGEAIRMLRVRGAPAIGVAGAMGTALAARAYRGDSVEGLRKHVGDAVAFLAGTRPTAVNLFWALERMKRAMDADSGASVEKLQGVLLEEALAVFEEDRNLCRRLGRNGAELLPDEATVLTHCNAGSLATADFGTALGVVYAAQEAGKTIRVYADETRPLLQGSRLTAWELRESGIDVTVLCDSAAASLMVRERIDCVIVGADRIAANGDTANKIGTYALAVLAAHHGIPFYVAAPTSTLDLSLSTGSRIPIEERPSREVTHARGVPLTRADFPVKNPSFDVTPARLIRGIVTEKGVARPPYRRSLKRMMKRPSS